VKKSARARRMARHHGRHKMVATLNLTAPLPDHMARTWDTFQWIPSDVPADPFEEDWG